MKVLQKGVMPDGAKIQIEEWHEDYDFMPYGGTVAAYPRNRKGEKFRAACDFDNNEQAKIAFENLISGEKGLKDFNFRSLKSGRAVSFEEYL